MAVPLVLKVFKGDELIATQEFQRDVIKIGRLQSAHLRLNDERVSRIHSVIEVSASGEISIIDMGSAEGTFVNGSRVNRGKLKAGDEVVLGGTRIIIELGAAVAAVVPVVEAAPPPDAAIATAPEMPAVIADNVTRPIKVRDMPQLATAQFMAALQVAPPIGASEISAPHPVRAPEPAAEAAHEPPPLPPSAPVAAYHLPVEEAWDQPHAEDMIRPFYTDEIAAEVLEFWGDEALLNSLNVRPGDDLWIGSTPRCRVFVPVEFLSMPEFHVITAAPDGFRLGFTAQMDGWAEINNERVPLKEIVKARKGEPHPEVQGAYRYTLAPGAAARLEMGPLEIEIRPVKHPKPSVGRFFDNLDLTYANLLLILFFVFGVMIVGAANTPLDLTAEQQEDFYKSQNRWTKIALKKPDKKIQELLAHLEKGPKGGDPGQAAAKAAGAEGQMGKKDAPNKDARTAPKAVRPSDKELVANSAVLKALGKMSGGLSTVFGGAGLGGSLNAALGHLTGGKVGDAQGFGGLGLKGTGGGGGGTSMTTFGIGGPGTKGRGGGLGTYGTGVGGLGGKGDAAIAVDAGDPVIMGSLDKELIRQVIHSHRSQIQYCYEKELNVNPNLAGKIMVYFVITATGSVSTGSVRETTMHNKQVEGCLVDRVKTWQFPKPKGGGIVVVTYPFIFKPAG